MKNCSAKPPAAWNAASGIARQAPDRNATSDGARGAAISGRPTCPAQPRPVKWSTPPLVLICSPPSSGTSPIQAADSPPNGERIASAQPGPTSTSGLSSTTSSRRAAAPRDCSRGETDVVGQRDQPSPRRERPERQGQPVARGVVDDDQLILGRSCSSSRAAIDAARRASHGRRSPLTARRGS